MEFPDTQRDFCLGFLARFRDSSQHRAISSVISFLVIKRSVDNSSLTVIFLFIIHLPSARKENVTLFVESFLTLALRRQKEEE